MGVSQKLLVRLPQTLVRALAIPEFNSLQILQSNIIRDPNHKINSSTREKAIFHLNNEIVLPINSINQISIVNMYKRDLIITRDTVVDFNLINDLKLKKLESDETPIIIPYASEVYNPIYHDVFNPLGLASCLKQSMYIRRNIKPKYIYDWIGMISDTQNYSNIPWFWKPLRMDMALYLERITTVAKHLKKSYGFLNKYLTSTNPILMLYSKNLNGYSLSQLLQSVYADSEKFRNQMSKQGVAIFVKPHRTEHFIPKDPIYKFKNVDIYYANNLIEHFIPSEIFINARKTPAFILSEWSSTLFNFQISEIIPIKNRIIQFKVNLLAGHRLQMNSDFNPYQYFKKLL